MYTTFETFQKKKFFTTKSMSNERPRDKNVTIADVADKAGVAVSTASMAFNNKPSISSETRRVVLQAAEDLDYHPTAAAQALVDGQASNIGLLVPTRIESVFFSTGFFNKLISGMNKAATETGNMISLQIVDSQQEIPGLIKKAKRAKNLSGSIITHPKVTMPYLNTVEKCNYPVVFLGIPLRNFPYVDNDNSEVAKLATEHLIDHGHERIAFLGGPDTLTASRQRKVGYENALSNAGIEVDPELIWEAKHSEQNAYSTVLEHAPRVKFTSICISVEVQMGGVHRALRVLGLDIPEDVALITIGDSHLAEYMEPHMTAVDLHTEELGYWATKKLNQLIHGENVSREKIIGADLIVRRSCGCK